MKLSFKTISAASGIAIAVLLGSTACGPTAENTNKPKTNSTANGNTNAVAPPPTTCRPASNDAILVYMQQSIEGDLDLAPRKLKFNYDSIDCTVYLVGSLGSIRNFKKLEKYALNAPDVVTMNNDHLWVDEVDAVRPNPQTEGCVDGWEKCGDICIPPGQSCRTNIMSLTASPSSSPTPK